MGKYNILQLRSSLGFFGAENVVVELAKSLSHTPYHSIVGVLKNNYNPHTEIVDAAKKNKLETKVFDCKSQLSLKTIFAIREFIKKNRIDIVQPHDYKSNFYALLSTLFLDKVSLISTCHPWTETSYSFKAKFYSCLDKRLLNKFSKIVAVSSDVKNEIIAHKISEEKISIIQNGIDINRFSKSFDREETCRKLKIDPCRKIVGTVGRMVKEKAHDIFLEAAKLVTEDFPEAYFIIVGDGPLKSDLDQRVETLNLQDHVLFPGVSDSIPEMLSLMDVFVLPSISEGLPMALLEAMAAKKPIVATTVGDVPDIISNNEEGLIVPPNNVSELKDAIEILLKDKQRADLFAQKAYVKVVQNFSSTIMAKKYIKVYEQLLSKEKT